MGELLQVLEEGEACLGVVVVLTWSQVVLLVDIEVLPVKVGLAEGTQMRVVGLAEGVQQADHQTLMLGVLGLLMLEEDHHILMLVEVDHHILMLGVLQMMMMGEHQMMMVVVGHHSLMLGEVHMGQKLLGKGVQLLSWVEGQILVLLWEVLHRVQMLVVDHLQNHLKADADLAH